MAYALSMCGPSLVVLVSGIVGTKLSPMYTLSTLPIAAFIIATACSSLPAAFFMKKYGRKAGFIFGNIIAILGCCVSFYALVLSDFVLFIFGSILIGANIAFVNQYRFALVEALPASKHAYAVSLLVFGGLFSAVIGPEAGLRGHMMLGTPYAGSFVLLAVLLLPATFLLYFGYKNQANKSTVKISNQFNIVSLFKNMAFLNSLFATMVAFGVMSLIMTATPISMHENGAHSLVSSKYVIQSHMVAMFLPSLFSAWLIRKIGMISLLVCGTLIYLAVAVIGLLGTDLHHYWWALVLLGIGWNFLFISSTSLLTETFKGEERFEAQGINDFLVFSVQALTSLGAGWALYVYGWNYLFIISLPFILTALVLGLYHLFKIKISRIQTTKNCTEQQRVITGE
ncbi:MAG: MFS transporter [Exilibacterium sp.]